MPAVVTVLIGVDRLTGSMEMEATSSKPARAAERNSSVLSRLGKLEVMPVSSRDEAPNTVSRAVMLSSISSVATAPTA